MTGWLGSLLLAICGAPQAWDSYKKGHSRGINPYFLLIWLGGELLTLDYAIEKGGLAPLVFNYLGNILFISIILYYKVRPRNG